ncbi:MAG: hypothetical protein HMLIMOIP_002582 [Candidatus Nitrosomirales archaeon]|jgi:hypothetical protein
MEETRGDVRPIPDPTELTSKAVDKAVQVSRDYTKQEIDHLKELMISQFKTIETWRIEQKEDTKNEVNAALTAAKEAVKEQTSASQLATNKSETNMMDQLKQLNATIDTANDALRRELQVLTARVGRIENLKQGGQDLIARGLAVIFGIAALVTILLYVQKR